MRFGKYGAAIGEALGHTEYFISQYVEDAKYVVKMEGNGVNSTHIPWR